MRDNRPTPIPAPTIAPDLDVVSVVGRTVRVRLHATTTGSRRGRPPGVAGASVFSHVGPEPSANVADWRFVGNTTRPTFDVEFDDDVAPGAQVWLTAFWYNPRAQSGPSAAPVTTHVQYGGISVAA